MDDEEDDVFEPDPNWEPTFREIRCDDKGTQTPCPVLAPVNGMVPCGISEEPRPLFHGNAGFRLHFPADFERVGDQEANQPLNIEEQPMMEQLPVQPLEALGMASIGQKLQRIGDQFHREQLQQYQQNQRNHGLLWWRLATALLDLLFDRGVFAVGARRR